MSERAERGNPGDVVPGTYREVRPAKLVMFDRNVSGQSEPGLLLAWRQQLGGDMRRYWHGLVLTATIRDQAVRFETAWLWDPKIRQARPPAADWPPERTEGEQAKGAAASGRPRSR